MVWDVILWEYVWSFNSVGCHPLGISVEFQQCGVSFSGNKCGFNGMGCHSLGISVVFQWCGV